MEQIISNAEYQKKYILKRPWQTSFGEQYILYLGYNEKNHIDSILEKDRAKRMTKEECESWLLILTKRHLWSMEEIKEENQGETNNANNN